MSIMNGTSLRASEPLRQAQIAATVAAVVPTLLAAQGMVAVGHDVLHLPLVAAVGLAAFLELGLVACALLARSSALAGRPAGADAIAVWVLSLVSGVLSALHELIGEENALGQRTWQDGAPSLLAAGVRLVAPLVAAWLWERVLVSARRELASRSLAEIRRDRRLLRLAQAALAVRRRESNPVRSQRVQQVLVRYARWRLDRRQVALLRKDSPTDPQLHTDIRITLVGLGGVDLYPALTIVDQQTQAVPAPVLAPPLPNTAAVEQATPAALDDIDQEYAALTGGSNQVLQDKSQQVGAESTSSEPDGKGHLVVDVLEHPEQEGPNEPLADHNPKHECAAPLTTQDPNDLKPQPAAPRARSLAGGSSTSSRPATSASPMALAVAGSGSSSGVELSPRLAAAVEIVRNSKPGEQLTGPALARALRQRGFDVSDSTGLRDLRAAREHLRPMPLKVVR